MSYTKLFSSIVASTIWREDDKVRLVWITMLAMKNERHIVEASLPGLADFARVSLEECEGAINKLSSPDKYSKNQEREGRRIEVCEGGWRILNGEYYRHKQSADERREYQKLYQRDYRKGETRTKPKRKPRASKYPGPTGREIRAVKAELNGDAAEAERIAAQDIPVRQPDEGWVEADDE